MIFFTTLFTYVRKYGPIISKMFQMLPELGGCFGTGCLGAKTGKACRNWGT